MSPHREAYQSSYQAFVPDRPHPACPYTESGECHDWQRGKGDAHGDHLMQGDDA
jgi:ribosome modulation factor